MFWTSLCWKICWQRSRRCPESKGQRISCCYVYPDILGLTFREFVFCCNFGVNSGSFGRQIRSILRYPKPWARCCGTWCKNCPKMRVKNAKLLPRVGPLSKQKWVSAWLLNFSIFQRPSYSLQKSTWRPFWVSKWGQGRSPECLFWGSNFDTRFLWKNATLPCENHIFCLLRCLKIDNFGYQNLSKIVFFSRPVLESVFSRFSSSKWEIWVPRQRPNLDKNRSQDASFEMSKNVSIKRSSETSDDQGQRPRQGGWGAYLVLRTK